MDSQDQAVLFNAVPLLVLAALYVVVSAALAPSFWRERRRIRDADVATALVFPFVAVAAALVGIDIARTRAPLGGHVWLGLVAIAIATVPALVVLASWASRGLALTSERRAREAEEETSKRDRQLGVVQRLSTALVGENEPTAIAGLLVREVSGLFGVSVAAFAEVSEDGATATYLGARDGERELDWLVGTQIDLRSEPSGIATAAADGSAFAVYDAQTSPRLNRELVERTSTRSAAFVPQVIDGRVAGVLVAGSHQPRVFTFDELELMRALVAEAGLALDRVRSAAALAAALERERLSSRIASHLRAELDVEAVLDVAVTEVGRALGLSRCFVRLGGPVTAEWRAPGMPDPGEDSLLTIADLAEAEDRTLAIDDVDAAPDLEPGVRETLVALGARAVLATPIQAHGELLGVLGLHRAEAGPWPEGAIALAETVAREAGIAVHTARLIAENQRRLAEQSALLEAGEALARELHFDAVMRQLVDEVSRLLDAEAAECWILESPSGRLRCRAVHGLPAEHVGRTIEPEGVFAEAIERGRPVLHRGDDAGGAPFAAIVVAPISTAQGVRGILDVRAREERRFDEGDLRLLEAFAGLGAIALRNAEAFEESMRLAQVQTGFFRIASVLGEPLSAAATLDAVAQAATEALGGTAAAVLKPVGSELELVGAFELPEPLRRLLDEQRPLETLADSAVESRLLTSSDLANDERFATAWRSAATVAGCRSLLAVPVEEPHAASGGLVVVFFEDVRVFADDDLELARQVAAAAQGALERSELFELERRARGLAQQLAHTGRELVAELDPDELVDELAHRAATLLGADGASVRLLEGEELVLHAASGPGSAAVLSSRSPSTAWLVGDIVQSREPASIVDAKLDERATDADPLVAAGEYRAYLGVPLVGPDGVVLGALAVLARRPREWRAEEVEALQALAANAAAALSSAELYQRVALEKERSEAILANVADGIVAVDRDGEVVLWNAAAERITGVPAHDAIGRTAEQALGRPLASEAGDAPVPGRLVPLRRGGEEVWLSLTEAVMKDPTGAVAGRIFAFRDISDERVVEQMKSDFVTTVSHELRTPLTSIYGFAETLLREDVQFGEDERRLFLGYIASESERVTTIVDTLLSAARLESGDVQLHLAPTDVGSVVAEAVRTLEAVHAGNGHDFVADLPPEPLDAQADRDKLRQVLNILLDNAIRYSPEGGKVVVAARRHDTRVEVRVEDEGIGIPVVDRERVFRKFYRGEGGGRVSGSGNAGLGLFIAEGLVEAMGGRIWVDPGERGGSTLVFELPAARTDRLRKRV